MLSRKDFLEELQRRQDFLVGDLPWSDFVEQIDAPSGPLVDQLDEHLTPNNGKAFCEKRSKFIETLTDCLKNKKTWVKEYWTHISQDVHDYLDGKISTPRIAVTLNIANKDELTVLREYTENLQNRSNYDLGPRSFRLEILNQLIDKRDYGTLEEDTIKKDFRILDQGLRLWDEMLEGKQEIKKLASAFSV
jgi:hypothetical protein